MIFVTPPELKEAFKNSTVYTDGKAANAYSADKQFEKYFYRDEALIFVQVVKGDNAMAGGGKR